MATDAVCVGPQVAQLRVHCVLVRTKSRICIQLTLLLLFLFVTSAVDLDTESFAVLLWLFLRIMYNLAPWNTD